MGRLTEEQLNQISYKIAGLPVLVEDSSTPPNFEDNPAQEEAETLVESEDDRLMRISKRIAGLK